jgi:hypothetical protein
LSRRLFADKGAFSGGEASAEKNQLGAALPLHAFKTAVVDF